MAGFVNTFFEEREHQLFSLAGLIEKTFSTAGLDYRIVGGLAIYLYVEEVEPDAGRLTKDIDIAVRREDLGRIAKAAEPFGLMLTENMLVNASQPSTRRAVHLVLADENGLGEARRVRGLQLIPLPDLVRMKLTSFRAKDEAHLKDLDEAGLITPQIEAALSPALAAHVAQMRARI